MLPPMQAFVYICGLLNELFGASIRVLVRKLYCKLRGDGGR